MLDKYWTWTYLGQSPDLGCALAVAKCPPIYHWTNIRQTLDMDIFWTKFGWSGALHVAQCPPTARPTSAHWTNSGQTLDKLWTNNEQTMDKQWTKYGFYKFPRFLPWAARGPLIASHGPLIARYGWATSGLQVGHKWATGWL